MTAYHAIDRARLRLGETVLVVGVGGVGSIAVQLAKAAGARVFAVETLGGEDGSGRVSWGQMKSSTQRKGELPAAVRDLTDGLGVDCVIDIVGQTETMAAGVESLRHGGRMVIVGYTQDHYPVEGKYLAQNELEILGTRAGRKQDLIEVSQLMSSGTDPFDSSRRRSRWKTRMRRWRSCVPRSNMGRIVLLTPAGRQAVEAE